MQCLVIAHQYCEWLSKDTVEKPKQYVVIRSRYGSFELSLQLHQWHINNHECKCHTVHDSENPNKNVLVENSWDQKCDETGQSGWNTPSYLRVVNMSYKPVVNGVVPFPPVFSQTSCIPPVGVESPISESCYFSPEVSPSMKKIEKEYEPKIWCWDSYVKSVNKNAQEIMILEMFFWLLANWENMLKG